MEQFSYVIALEDTEERVDKWISDTLPDISRSYIQKLIKDQLVFVNRVPCKANYRLKLNDEILFQIPQAVQASSAQNARPVPSRQRFLLPGADG